MLRNAERFAGSALVPGLIRVLASRGSYPDVWDDVDGRTVQSCKFYIGPEMDSAKYTGPSLNHRFGSKRKHYALPASEAEGV